MNETVKKINNILTVFNKTFQLSANIINDNNESVANGLKINKLKNDGTQFITEFFDMFNQILNSISDEYELVFNEKKGLVIAKKVIKVEYIIEDLDESNIEDGNVDEDTIENDTIEDDNNSNLDIKENKDLDEPEDIL